MSEDADIYFESDDLPYEEDILKNPYSVKSWLRYIDFKKNGTRPALFTIYERAVKQLPGSYKLWYGYLKLRRTEARKHCSGDSEFDEANSAHERALVFMHKMPRIWLDYCSFLVSQGRITRTRRTFDRAIRALPITQHDRIWKPYLRFCEKYGDKIHESSLRIYRRYIKFAPDNTEKFIGFLLNHGDFDEAAVRLAAIINDDDFVSQEGKSKHQLWNDLCQLICKNPRKITSLKVDPILRQGIRRYTDQVGVLWNSLAEYYFRDGNFARARDVYEEAMERVLTVRDFNQVFDAYQEFEQSLVTVCVEAISSTEDPEPKVELDLECGMARLEWLLDRRPILINSVKLRQNPHSVPDWHERVTLHEAKGARAQFAVYMEAVNTVEPAKVTVGRPSSLWIELSRLYEKHGQLEDARLTLEKATDVAYVSVDDLSDVWCEWSEMEIRHEHYKEALSVLARATANTTGRKVDYYDKSETVQARVHKSKKLWNLYADMEESYGTFQTTKALYENMLDLRIASPVTIINFGVFLEENNYFEEAFKAYEKGLALFKWPHVYDIWTTYLTKFIGRYGGSKLERARDLFEQCLKDCPAKYAKTILLLYAKLEEEHGLARRAMKIYERATSSVMDNEKFDMFTIWIQRITDLFGVTHTRPAYQRAVEELKDDQARTMGIRFADMERKLGEIDRARAIYAHCAQFCDPRSTGDFWRTWKDFEIAHGNEDTLREMTRIQRSVQAVYNTTVNFMSSQVSGTAVEAGAAVTGNQMERLEAEARLTNQEAALGKVQFVTGGRETTGDVPTTSTANPEAIDIDDDDESSEEEEEEAMEIAKIPKEVFGGLKGNDDDDDDDD